MNRRATETASCPRWRARDGDEDVNRTVKVHVQTPCYRYTPVEEEVEHESALPHQRVNKYDLFCVGSDSRAPGEEQLQIFKMLTLGEEKKNTLEKLCVYGLHS